MQSEATAEWLNEVDKVGPFGPLAVIRKLLDSAPEDVRNSREYGYVSGMLDMRLALEGGEDE